MEESDGTATAVQVKRERPSTPDHLVDEPVTKHQANETSKVAHTPVIFPWRECQKLSDVQRLKIKEKAVKDARENCQKIRALLEPALAVVEQNPDSKQSVIMGGKIIKQWLDQDGKC